MMEAMTNKEVAFMLTAVAVSLGSFWMLAHFAGLNTTISGNLAQSRIAGQEAINTVLSLQNYGMLAMTGSLQFCKDPADPKLSCMDFLLTTCQDEIDAAVRPCLLQNDAPYTSDTWRIQGANGLFSRKIRVTDIGMGDKKITVLIWWSDEGGFHNSPISHIIPDEP